jgi:hypothetical protein
MNQKKLFWACFLTMLLILVITEPAFNFLNKGLFNDLENILFAPLFYMLFSYSVASIFLIFFSHRVFTMWLRKIVFWFLPLSIIILVMADPRAGGVVAFSRTDYAIGLGFILIGTTLIFALIQRFYFKR